MTNTYTEPVSALLTFGEVNWEEWDDYSQLGLTDEHISALIRLGSDHHLLVDIDELTDDELWAPMHAWRVLAEMQAVEALAPLAKVFDWSEESETDLINEGLTEVFEKFGALAFEPLTVFINEPDHEDSGYINATNVISRIGVQQPELRDRAVAIITSALDAHFLRNDEEVNGFWLADLLDLKAVESYPIIKKVFEAEMISPYVAGDLEDVEIEFGMREERETPAPRNPLFTNFSKPDIKIAPKQKHKEKNKNKQAKKSRKKNRKKK